MTMARPRLPQEIEERLKNELRYLYDTWVIDAFNFNELHRAIEAGRYDLVEPKRVVCGAEYPPVRGRGVATLGNHICPRCRTVVPSGRIEKHGLQCQSCGERGSLQQAPIFVPLFEQKPARKVWHGEVLKDLLSDRNARACPHYGGRRSKRLRTLDSARPVESLTWLCHSDNEPECPFFQIWNGFPLCTYDDWTRTGVGRGVRPSIRIPAIVTGPIGSGTRDVTFFLMHPSESITRSISFTFHDVGSRGIEVAHPSELAPGVRSVTVHTQTCSLIIHQITVGIVLGSPRSPYSLRAFYCHESPTEPGRPLFLYRNMSTHAIRVAVRDESLKVAGSEVMGAMKLADERRARFIVLHTLAHALLRNIPLLTGLDPSDFGEIVDPDRHEIVLYDNAPGGLGGCSQFADEMRLANLFHRASQSLDCPLGCDSGCRYCMFSESCGTLNRNLHRPVLQHFLRSFSSGGNGP